MPTKLAKRRHCRVASRSSARGAWSLEHKFPKVRSVGAKGIGATCCDTVPLSLEAGNLWVLLASGICRDNDWQAWFLQLKHLLERPSHSFFSSRKAAKNTVWNPWDAMSVLQAKSPMFHKSRDVWPPKNQSLSFNEGLESSVNLSKQRICHAWLPSHQGWEGFQKIMTTIQKLLTKLGWKDFPKHWQLLSDSHSNVGSLQCIKAISKHINAMKCPSLFLLPSSSLLSSCRSIKTSESLRELFTDCEVVKKSPTAFFGTPISYAWTFHKVDPA